MSYKVLEQNGVEIENVDGGVMNRLAVGGRNENGIFICYARIAVNNPFRYRTCGCN